MDKNTDNISLKEYVLSLVDTNNKRYEERFDSIAKIVEQGSREAKEAVKAALDAQKEAVNAALTAAKEAVTKAEVASEKRFDSVNEFRNTLSDQQRNLMPRSEAEIQFKGLNEKFDGLNLQSVSKAGEGVGLKEAFSYLVAIIGVIIGLSRFIK